MAKIYRTAMGKTVDIDNLRLSNENVIAVGNMKVNARGDELGPGGKVIKTRDQIMKEYYALNTPTAVDPAVHIAPKKIAPKTSRPAQPARKDVTIPVMSTSIDPISGLDEDDQELPLSLPSHANIKSTTKRSNNK